MDLNSLLPQSARVIVGEQQIKMREPSIQQTARILKVVQLLDLEAIAGPLVRLFAGGDTADAELDTATEFSAIGMIERIREVGPDLVAAAKPLLGGQVGPAIQQAAIACIDSRATRAALIAGQVIDKDAPQDTNADGVYLGCPAVRAWAAEEMTSRQATAIIKAAVGMMDIAGSAKNLVGALMVDAPNPDEE